MEEKKILMNDVELNNISGGRDTNKTERENHDKVRYLSSKMLSLYRYDPEYGKFRKAFTDAYEEAEQKWYHDIWNSPDWGPNILFSDYFDPEQFVDDYYCNH